MNGFTPVSIPLVVRGQMSEAGHRTPNHKVNVQGFTGLEEIDVRLDITAGQYRGVVNASACGRLKRVSLRRGCHQSALEVLEPFVDLRVNRVDRIDIESVNSFVRGHFVKALHVEATSVELRLKTSWVTTRGKVQLLPGKSIGVLHISAGKTDQGQSQVTVHSDSGGMAEVGSISSTVGGGAILDLGSTTRLVARETRNVGVMLSEGAQFVTRGKVEDVCFKGDGSVQFDDGTGGHRIRFVPDPDKSQKAPSLLLGEFATLIGCTGTVRLEKCLNARLEGHEQIGLEIAEWSADDKSSTFEGASLRAIRMPVEYASLSMLAQAQRQAFEFVPLVSDSLPGGKVLLTGAEVVEGPNDPAVRAQYASAIALLAESKGSPPSVRTRLVSNDYRMRLSQAHGFDFAMYSLYRLIGFGERPGPPLLLFVALSGLFTLLGLRDNPLDLSWGGLCTVGTSFEGWLLSPLHLVSDGIRSTEENVSQCEVAGRALLTVVFGTAVLALRKYVKREHVPG